VHDRRLRRPGTGYGTLVPEPTPQPTEDSTVDDWFGQNVARDQDLADELVDEEGGDLRRAEERFEEEAEGQDRYDAGHPRPADRD
jgi:hypothetical protein